MDKSIQTLKEWMENSGNIVFFGGAGVSTESGIPDFRSVDGLYRQKYDYPPEEVLSYSFFARNTEYFYRFYRDKMLFLDAEPNACHRALAALEEQGRLRAVVTQNIDGLHSRAGSKSVFELHGSVLRNYCRSCHAPYTAEFIKSGTGIPVCEKCGGLIKPDVVLYEEALDSDVMQGAVEAIAAADMLIVGGTSLVVWPAAGLVRYYRGKKLVMINKSATDMDGTADLIIREGIASVFSQIMPGV